MMTETSSNGKNLANSFTKENTDKRQNPLNITNGDRKSNIRPSKCITKN